MAGLPPSLGLDREQRERTERENDVTKFNDAFLTIYIYIHVYIFIYLFKVNVSI